MNKNLQIQDALTNAEPYIHLLASMPDERLERKLRIVHSQMDIALKNKQQEAMELLSLWEKQIIEARLLKEEKEIKPYVDEMEQVLSAIEGFKEEPVVIADENTRVEEENQYEHQEKPSRKETPQLSLF